MNFNNWVSFSTAIICAVLGITAWYFKLDFASFYGFTPSWGEITIFMLVMHSVNISLLAKDLQERPKEWTGGTLVQRQVKDSIAEMLKTNRDNQLLKQSKKETA